MAKRRTSRQVAKKDQGLVIERGGEVFTLEKSPDLFAVKKRPRSVRGSLQAAEASPQSFPKLKFRSGDSGREVEVYQVSQASLEKAMTAIRKQGGDVTWCAHIYHMPGDEAGLMIPTDSIYVELETDANPDLFNELLQEYGLEVMRLDDQLPNAYVLKLTSASTMNPIKIANALREQKSVKLAEPDFSMRMALMAYRPSDTLFSSQWHLENLGGVGLTAGADVKAPEAWEITRGSRSVVICIMDDGVETDHPDFSSPGKIVGGYDFGQDDPDPRPALSDDNHGTACAGVALADENGEGVVGLAPGCAMMPIRTSGMIDDNSIEALFNHARVNGADVISCSWGVATGFYTLSTRMKRVITRAATEGRDGRGCVILFAAGNEDVPVDGTDEDGNRVRSGFAIHPDVIAVSASNSHDRRSHYSNYGAEIWICAPSSGSGGRGIVTTDRSGSSGYQQGNYTTSSGFGGTSSSTPLVAGLCGLILSVNPELSAAEVKEVLQETADPIDQASGNYSNGHSDWYGYGRINAARAVTAARDRLAPVVNRQLRLESHPGVAIPDKDAVGIIDSIRVNETARVQSIQVSLDIQHTYQGDLQVRLIAPDGNEAMLHNRKGGSQDDLVRDYTQDDAPGLSALHGQSAQGDWRLAVADLAAIDTGVLRNWSLTLGLDGATRTEWETAPGLHIPDRDPAGVTSELMVDGQGSLKEIELTIDITHTWRGDLSVELVSPGGTAARVHHKQGGSEDNLQQTLRGVDTPVLQALVDAAVEINGAWQLKVADLQSQDVGKLNSWKLMLRT